MFIQILAPGYFFFYRDHSQADVGRKLIAWMQDLLCSSFGHAHFAFDDGDSRALHARVHGKYRACDRDAAIPCSHIKMSAGALGCLNDDVASLKLDSSV